MDFQQRLLPKKLAAKYVGGLGNLALSKVQPIKTVGHPKYDVKDLDKWIDAVKAGGGIITEKEWLDML